MQENEWLIVIRGTGPSPDSEAMADLLHKAQFPVEGIAVSVWEVKGAEVHFAVPAQGEP